MLDIISNLQRKEEQSEMEEKRRNRRQRLILFPLPIQGCINPMIQLAKILYSQGFSITIIHTQFNSPCSSIHPNFTFIPISDGISPETLEFSTQNVSCLISHLNASCESPFRNCVAELLERDGKRVIGEERIVCLIDDCSWQFTRDVAEFFGIPRIVLQTYIGSFFLAHAAFPVLIEKGYLPLQDAQNLNSPVPELPPLKKKDLLPILGKNPTLICPMLKAHVGATKASSGIIFDSCEELEQDTLARTRKEFGVPVFAIGPFPSYFPSSSSSLFQEDSSCISWLDNQEPDSVLYVSFGSVVTITETEFLEIAWGLRNSNQPFLWVVRPGLVRGSDPTELLPDGFVGNLQGRGKLVKWAPQIEVLRHGATGAFWTHCGWNSVLESICNGVPMICHPVQWDQMMNARYVCDVWRIGFHLENRIQRGEISDTVGKLMADEEGGEVRRRIQRLKERVEERLKPGGSSHQSLQDLVDYISSF